MITNFEDVTQGLTHHENTVILPKLIELLKWRKGKENAITNKKLVNLLTAMGHDIQESRIRKLINQIRLHGLVKNLLATYKGYYVSNDQKEVQKYVLSLRERADAINAVANSLVQLPY